MASAGVSGPRAAAIRARARAEMSGPASAAATSGAPPSRPGVPMAKRTAPAAIEAAWASALNDRSMTGSPLPRQATTSRTLSITLRMNPPGFQFGSAGCASPLTLVQRASSVSVPDDGAATSALQRRKP